VWCPDFSVSIKEQKDIKKRVAFRKLEGKINSLKMLIDGAPSDIRDKMKKQIIEKFK